MAYIITLTSKKHRLNIEQSDDREKSIQKVIYREPVVLKAGVNKNME